MLFVNKNLEREYNFWVDQFSEESVIFDGCELSIIDVLNAHYSIADFFLEDGGCELNVSAIGPRDKNLLLTAISSQKDHCAKKIECKPKYEACATLFYQLIKLLPFHSCNKATALLTALYFLTKISRAPATSDKELEVITRIIASNTIRDREGFKQYLKFENGEIHFLGRYLQENTVPIDSKDYSPTYFELDKILSDFGFSLNSSHGNSIGIYRIETRSTIFRVRKNKQKRIKVGVIPFSGWTKAVSESDLKQLREYTGLIKNDNFEASLVYKFDVPLLSLVNKYHHTLQTLVK